MAALTFAYEFTLPQDYLNTCIGNEPDGQVLQFGIDNEHQVNAKGLLTLSNYTALTWEYFAALMTQRAVSRIGIKNFPQIGACGFYVDKYTGQTIIFTPISAEQQLFDPPVLAISEVSEGLSVTITPPEGITYTCYKIIMRSGYYANEYVAYELSTILPKPTTIGLYDIFAIGYNEDTGVMSSWSNVVILNVTSGKPNWNPDALSVPMSLADLVDVNLVDVLNAQSLRYNTVSGKWENANTGDILVATLLVENWSGSSPYTQTVSVAGIVASGYSYVVTPDDESWEAYAAAGIYASDPSEDGSITFNATEAMPSVVLTVNILKVRAT